MDDTVKTKQCLNCKTDILSNNYITHSIHCQRHFYLCSKCQKPVKYSQSEEHDAEYHVLVHCKNCHSQFEKWHLSDHLENDCPHRNVKCRICDVDIEVTSIEEHEDYCGSRTEKCIGCKEFVMLKYKSLHVDSNHMFFKYSDETGPSPSWQNRKNILGDFIPDSALQSKKVKSTNRKRHVKFTNENETSQK